MDLMDDQSNASTSNEIGLAVSELHALTQGTLPGSSSNKPSTAQKMYSFSSGLSRTSSDNNLNSLPGLNVQMNSEYISKITCPTLRRISPRSAMNHIRMRPYMVPARHRTRSENSGSVAENESSCDNNEISIEQTSSWDPDNWTLDFPMSYFMDTIEKAEFATATKHTSPTYNLDDFSNNVLVTKVKILKKSKSLEELRSDDNIDGSQPSHEMEFVSNRIQKLKVQE